MNIKERIDMIKAKQEQIEALISAKEKEVEEEYQMVMELYNETKNRVEAIQQKQKKTEDTLDRYDSLLAFLNDGVETTEEPVVEENSTNQAEEVKTEEESLNKEDSETTANDSSEDIDELLKLIDSPKKEEFLNKEEKKEVKQDSKWKVELGEEQSNLIDQIGAL